MKYQVKIGKWDKQISRFEVINKVGSFDTLSQARKSACKYIGTSNIYYAEIDKITNEGREHSRTIRYYPQTGKYAERSGHDVINPKTGELVSKSPKTKPVPRDPRMNGPVTARYYACYDDNGYKPEFWADNLNDLRKRVLRYSSHTFMDVYDTKLQKYVGIIEVLEWCWRTPSDNWYHIKEDGSVGSRTSNPWE